MKDNVISIEALYWPLKKLEQFIKFLLRPSKCSITFILFFKCAIRHCFFKARGRRGNYWSVDWLCKECIKMNKFNWLLFAVNKLTEVKVDSCSEGLFFQFFDKIINKIFCNSTLKGKKFLFFVSPSGIHQIGKIKSTFKKIFTTTTI